MLPNPGVKPLRPYSTYHAELMVESNHAISAELEVMFDAVTSTTGRQSDTISRTISSI